MTPRKLIWLALMALIAAPLAAEARVVVGVGVGVPAYYPYPAYAYPPPYPYPYAYAPPPAMAVPPPGLTAPPPGYAGPAAPPSPNQQMSGEPGEVCREYNGKAVIDGQRQTIYGHACRQPDGSWRIVE